jgi:hypothetical protein
VPGTNFSWGVFVVGTRHENDKTRVSLAPDVIKSTDVSYR